MTAEVHQAHASPPPGRDPSALRQTFASIIERFLGGDEQQALRDADDAGRRTVGLDGGLLTLVDAYHAALERATGSAGSARDAARVVERAAQVLTQSLASYEAMQSGSDPKAVRHTALAEAEPKVPPRADWQELDQPAEGVEAQSDERTRIASAIHADAVESLAAVATRLDLLARQLDDREEAASIEKLREAVVAAHSTTVILAGVHEEQREGAHVPALIAVGRASTQPSTPETVLTGREGEVLSMISAGATNAEIADRLVISQSTVKSHVKNILRKLRVKNRTQAAARHFGP